METRFRIVVALDGSEYSNIVLEHALDQASRHDAVDVHVLRVVDRRDDLESLKTWLAQIVRDSVDAMRPAESDWRVRLHVRRGKAAEEIAAFAGDLEADLLVVGRYGVHHRRHSTAEQIVPLAECPTLVVGLAGHEAAAQRQCEACVQIRRDTDAERLFCDEHTDNRDLWLSTLVLPQSALSGTSSTPL
jgi:nucleotide-binding universal stress UspA family protein